MEERAAGASAGQAQARVPCTPPAASQLYEIAVLDTTAEDGRARWHTIGWGVDRTHAQSLAESYVTRPLCPYEEARIRHNGRLVAVHRRPA